MTDPSVLLAKLIGTDGVEDFNGAISTWVSDQVLAAIRAVLPDLVSQHGVLAMGQLQDATGDAALAKANQKLAAYGLAVTTFAELNVNLPDSDAEQIKQFAAAKAYTGVAGSFDLAVRGEAALQIAHGVADGNVGAQPGIVAGMMMGVPVSPGAPTSAAAAPVPGQPAPSAARPHQLLHPMWYRHSPRRTFLSEVRDSRDSRGGRPGLRSGGSAFAGTHDSTEPEADTPPAP